MDEPNEQQPSAPPAVDERDAGEASPGAYGVPGAPTWQARQTAQPEPATPQYPAYPAAPSSPPAPTPESQPAQTQPVQPQYPSYPAYAAYPGSPSMPLQGTPPFQGAPSTPLPGTPAAAGMPDAPTYPTYPGYAGAPSAPLGAPVPGAPGMFAPASTPTFPGYPGYPGSPSYPVYPGYPGYPGGPLVPFAAPLTVPLAPAPQNALARPFPTWLTATVGVGSLALVSLVYILAELVGHADWADGAHTAGLVALGLAGVALIVTILRAALGRRAGAALALAAVLVVGLSAAGTGGVVASPQLHNAQAHALESSQTWAGAVHEYMLAGEQPPNAPDIARTLDEQGEQQLAQGDYKDALATFNSVGTRYAQSGDPVGRANDDVFKTYSAWVKSNGSDVPYSDAISFFEQYRTASSCSASCASAAADIEAQALYQYGTSLAAGGDYTDAITQFEKITASFASSTYAAQAHTAAATAYLAVGKQELTQECAAPLPAGESPTTALATYQKLATTYADTPEGVQAKAALAAPQNVVGHFQTAMHNTVLFLSKQLNLSSGFESDNYRTTIGASSTMFTFTRVAQGKYYVTFVDNTGTPFYIGALNNPTLFPVGPLCATDLGTFQ